MDPDRRWSFVSRRAFVIGGAAAGAAAALAPWLPAARADGRHKGRGARGRRRERRTLHFDLSGAEIAEARLHAPRSRHHGVSLRSHTDRTRRHARIRTPHLRGVPDHRLTHYLEEVDLPADALQSVFVVGTLASGEPALLGVHVHVPQEALHRHARHAAARGKRRNTGRAGLLGAQLVQANSFSSPLSAAIWLVFHHPEILNLDPAQGADILQRIQTLGDERGPYLQQGLVQIITNSWPATPTHGWAHLVVQTDAAGQPVHDAQGNPVYRYDVLDPVLRLVGQVVPKVLASIFDDDAFEGSNWHAVRSLAAVAADGPPAGAEPFRVAATCANGSWRHGVQFVGLDVVDAGQRLLKLTVRNVYLRFLSVFVQYLDAGGHPVDVGSHSPLDTDRSHFVRNVASNGTFNGIPLPPSATELVFAIPPQASQARVIFGSLGLGGEAFSPEALPGSALTLAINFGIPVMLLALGVGGGEELAEALEIVLADDDLVADVVEFLREQIEGEYGPGPFGEDLPSSQLRPFLLAMADVAVKYLLEKSPRIAAILTAFVTGEELVESAPLLGPMIKIAALAATGVELAETMTEVLACPAIFDDVISLSTDTTVVVQKDPRDFELPATATHFAITAVYDKAVPRTAAGPVPRGVPSLSAPLVDVPSGGMVRIDVVLLSANGCVVAHGGGSFVNDAAHASQIEIPITETGVPIRPDTVYHHSAKLSLQGSNYVWLSSAAPATTLASPDQFLGVSQGITVQTPTGLAGYAYTNIVGATFGNCQQASQDEFLMVLKNVSLGASPLPAFRRSRCGFKPRVGIVYNPVGNGCADPRDCLYVRPVGDGAYDVVSLGLLCPGAADDAFDFSSPLSFGRFNQELDAIAWHPAGYLVGVSRTHHKMELLDLLAAAVDPSTAPNRVPYAVVKSGPGTRPGLLGEPVGIAVFNQVLLVLEQGNQRLQSFDMTGEPVDYFLGGTSAVLPLPAGAVYKDVGVESTGLVYVLYHVNDGHAPSDYRLAVYEPSSGRLLTQTQGVTAAKLAVDAFRNVYTVNYEALGLLEPSVSQWVPITPCEAGLGPALPDEPEPPGRPGGSKGPGRPPWRDGLGRGWPPGS